MNPLSIFMIYILPQVKSVDIIGPFTWYEKSGLLIFSSLDFGRSGFVLAFPSPFLHLSSIHLTLNSLSLRLPRLDQSLGTDRPLRKLSKIYVLKIIEAIEERYGEFSNNRTQHGSFQQENKISSDNLSLTHAHARIGCNANYSFPASAVVSITSHFHCCSA
jgi:hypothetical protein